MDEYNFKRALCKIIFNSRRVKSDKEIFERVEMILSLLKDLMTEEDWKKLW